MYDHYKDRPKAVGAYHFGSTRLQDWFNGYQGEFENPQQRANSYDYKEVSETKKSKEAGKTLEQLRLENAQAELAQWREMQGYLPYIFLGNPHRYDSMPR